MSDKEIVTQDWLDENPDSLLKVGDEREGDTPEDEEEDEPKEDEDAPKEEAPKVEDEVEAPKEEAPKVEDEVEAPKEEAPKVEDEVEAPKEEEVPVTPPTSKLTYMGKNVIGGGVREVNGVKYNHLTLEDGTTHDLTNEEYVAKVTVAQ